MTDPVFNKQNDINALNKELKKSSLSLHNRLQSILHDAKFVTRVRDSFPHPYPLIANERCGLWYVPTQDRSGTCYFKSTDGHTNVWSFSYRRLNLHLLSLVRAHGAVIVVDSTRRGKRMPDAMLKTIPIWCAVLTSVLYRESPSSDHWLRTPEMVPQSERHAILQLIPGFIRELQGMNLVDREKYKLDKPLCPRWIYPGCPAQEVGDDECYYIYCVSASRKVSVHKSMTVRGDGDDDGGAPSVSFEYVQGSADDHELWIPETLPHFGADEFWDVADEIVDGSTGFLPAWYNDDELKKKLAQLLLQPRPSTSSFELHDVGATNLKFGKIINDVKCRDLPADTTVVVFHDRFKILRDDDDDEETSARKVLAYAVPSNKRGSNMLRSIIPEVMSKIDLSAPLVVLCETGQDICMGIVLAVLYVAFDLDWNRVDAPPAASKALVKQHLSKLSESHKVNPSRSTLQSVNSFLFSSNMFIHI